MKVLVVGKGGREHALVWKIAQSPRVEKVYCAPGNAGTAFDGENVPIADSDIEDLLDFAKAQSVGLTVVGPEAPLAAGIVDRFQEAGLRIFGPTKAAAQLEASKAFAKTIMSHADVPTAEFRVCDHPDHAREYITSRLYPLVVKADGLAAGKGVYVCSTQEEAQQAVQQVMINEVHGREAGRQVIIEKRLQGQELSVLAVVSGRSIITLQSSQDHKPAYDNDEGPNTGGMGAYSPTPLATPELMEEIEEKILVPTIHAMRRNRQPFSGILYAGLILTPQGPKVLEYNCRLGDPEAQPVLFRLKTDIVDLLEAAVEERLDELPEPTLEWDPRPAVCVVMASKGYPGSYEKEYLISGLDEVAEMEDVKVFHAGTKLDGDKVRTDGGRVLGVTARGDTLEVAQQRAYKAVETIQFLGAYWRTDIGNKALEET